MASDNLKKFTSEQSREEAAKNGKKGGIASGEARRKKKAMREVAEMVLGSQISLSDEKIRQQLKEKGVSDDDMTYQTAVVFATLGQALKGNVKAVTELRDMAGEKVQEIKVNTVIDDKVKELEEMLDDIE